jgi:hypothetical protein
MTPVTRNGETDESRPVLYMGQTQILTPAGALPLGFEIEADNLRAAIDGFGDAAQEAVERAARELEELRRDAASSIVVPDLGSGPVSPPGGGKIQFP